MDSSLSVLTAAAEVILTVLPSVITVLRLLLTTASACRRRLIITASVVAVTASASLLLLPRRCPRSTVVVTVTNTATATKIVIAVTLTAVTDAMDLAKSRAAVVVMKSLVDLLLVLVSRKRKVSSLRSGVRLSATASRRWNETDWSDTLF